MSSKYYIDEGELSILYKSYRRPLPIYNIDYMSFLQSFDIKEQSFLLHKSKKLLNSGIIYSSPIIERRYNKRRKKNELYLVFGEIKGVYLDIKFEYFINIILENIPIERKVIRLIRNIFVNHKHFVFKRYSSTLRIRLRTMIFLYFKELYSIIFNLFEKFSLYDNLDAEDIVYLELAFSLVDKLHRYVPEYQRLRKLGLLKNYNDKFKPKDSLFGEYIYKIVGNSYTYQLGSFSHPYINMDLYFKSLGTDEEDCKKMYDVVSKYKNINLNTKIDKKYKIKNSFSTLKMFNFLNNIKIHNPIIKGIIHKDHPFLALPNEDPRREEYDELSKYFLILSVGIISDTEVQVLINLNGEYTDISEYLFFNSGYYPSIYEALYYLNEKYRSKYYIIKKYTEVKKLNNILNKVKNAVVNIDVNRIVKEIHDIRMNNELEDIYYFDLNLDGNILKISTDPYYGDIKKYEIKL